MVNGDPVAQQGFIKRSRTLTSILGVSCFYLIIYVSLLLVDGKMAKLVDWNEEEGC